MSEWADKQYSKIQNFVIHNKLYKGTPNTTSHADIVIDLAQKASYWEAKAMEYKALLENVERVGK